MSFMDVGDVMDGVLALDAEQNRKLKESGYQYFLQLNTKAGFFIFSVFGWGNDAEVKSNEDIFRFGKWGTTLFWVHINSKDSQPLITLYGSKEVIPKAQFKIVRYTQNGGVQNIIKIDIENAYIIDVTIHQESTRSKTGIAADIYKLANNYHKQAHLKVFDIKCSEFNVKNYL